LEEDVEKGEGNQFFHNSVFFQKKKTVIGMEKQVIEPKKRGGKMNDVKNK
jgi:hypothetical protein